MYKNNSDHMTKMAAMSVYMVQTLQIFFSRTGEPISTELGMNKIKLRSFKSSEHINEKRVSATQVSSVTL